MLTCHMCGHTGLDVHEYKYIGNPVLLVECGDLVSCFNRAAANYAVRRAIVKPPDYPCVGEGYQCQSYDPFLPVRCQKNRQSCESLAEYHKYKMAEK